MHKKVEDFIKLQKMLIVLEYAKVLGSNLEAYEACRIPRSSFYDWKKAYTKEGEEGFKPK